MAHPNPRYVMRNAETFGSFRAVIRVALFPRVLPQALTLRPFGAKNTFAR